MPTHTSSPVPAIRTTSILRRMVTQASILVTFIIVLFSTVSFMIAQSMVQQSVLTQLSSLASASEDGLEQTLSLAQERASLLSLNADVKRVFARQAGSKDLDHLLTLLQRDEPALAGIEVYGSSAELLAHTGESIGLPTEALNVPYHRAIIGKQSWDWYDAFTPVWDEHAHKIGVIALRYDATFFVAPLLRLAPAIGATSHIVFGTEQSGKIVTLHPNTTSKSSYILYLKDTDEDVSAMPIARAAHGEEGVGRFMDEDGKDVLAAYRTLPSLGWGMAVEMERTVALRQTQSLAFSDAMLGGLLILLAMSLAYLLASELTLPLRTLTRRVMQLRPGQWQMQRAIHTGDEVETLDAVISDLSLRLQRVYRDQEREIAKRTDDLKKQYTLDRTILDGIDQGVITVDRKGIVTGLNPAAAKFLLRTREEVIGLSAIAALDLRGHRGTTLTAKHPLSVCLEKNREVRSPANAHWSIMRNNDTMLPIMLAVSPLNEGKKTFGAIIVLQDITEERRLDYLKSEFITLASHQLRTPLSAIRWYVELFQEEKKNLTPNQKSYLREIDNGLVRMVALLTALLHAAHLEGEGLKPELQTVDIGLLVREMEKDCETMAGEAGVICALAAPRRTVFLHTDPTLLRIVLQNLISNAVKYSRKGKRISIGFSAQKTRIVFSVEDQGVGIPLAEQKRVFQRFFRAKNVRQLDTDGNGLGLYITKSIVERLGGTIEFKSIENEGTTFTVSFPITQKKTK
jgi:PAS domain S-box-containing protein